MASSIGPIDKSEREHGARNGQGQAYGNARHQLQRSGSGTLNIADLDPLTPLRSSPSTERDEDSENEEDPLPGRGEAPTSSLTVREAIGGLFSTHGQMGSGGSQ